MIRRVVHLVAIVVALAAVATGCSIEPAADSTVAPSVAPPSSVAPLTTAVPSTVPLQSAAAVERIVTPSGDRTGNRVASGVVDLTRRPVEVNLDAPAAWILGSESGGDVIWVVADADGSLVAFAESGGEITETDIRGAEELPAGAPPVLRVRNGDVTVLEPALPPSATVETAPLAGHTIVDGVPIVVAGDGTVFVGDHAVTGVVALPDGRPVVSARGEVAFLAEPTDRLGHGVLGDLTEAESVVILEPGEATIRAAVDAPGDAVFEAVAPMWADVDGDGVEEILVTASDAASGARLVVFSADGRSIAESPAIGTGSRWLNQLVVAPVGPSGEIEVIEVRTPHIGGIVQWYRLAGDSLVLHARAAEFSTHTIGSRNLDQGVVVDADGDGMPDVVVPSQNQEAIVALTRVDATADIVLSVPLDGRLSSNLAAVTRSDGTTSLALGTDDGRLMLWP